MLTARTGRLAVCLAVLTVPVVYPAMGQFTRVWTPGPVQVDQPLNLFATWDGADALSAAYLTLPAGWVLRHAYALQHGYERIPVQTECGGEANTECRIRLQQAESRPLDLVFAVQAGEVSGPAEWRLEAEFTSEADRSTRKSPARGYALVERLHVDPLPIGRADNLAQSFSGDAAFILKGSGLPDLGTSSPYTVEFWMQSTALDEVVLSTWNGDEVNRYPLELVVSRNGRLRFYRGEPGRHQSMTSRRPVADGRWHHVAVTNDPATGWSRLLVDGAPVDSLLDFDPPRAGTPALLALGGRLPRDHGEVGIHKGFSGRLDEIRFWPRARTSGAIQRFMRQPISQNGGEAVAMGFEQPIPPALLARSAAGVERVPSTLLFVFPIDDLRATVQGRSVGLSWQSRGRLVTAFVVERRVEGGAFEEVGRIPADERPDGEPGSYRFIDESAMGNVLYYRIRQVLPNGAERLSGTVKLGLAEVDEPVSVLVGNFPNPFSVTTTVAFELAEAQHVNLSVWDLSGQSLAVLLDKSVAAGYHEVQFVADGLPSGTYFLRMQTPAGSASRKMLLMK